MRAPRLRDRARRLRAAALGLLLALAPLALAPQARAAAESGTGGEAGPPAADAESGPAPTAEELERLVETLEDESARAELVSQLRTLLEARRSTAAEPDEPGDVAAFLDAASQGLAAAGERVRELAGRIARPQAAWGWLRAQVVEPELRLFWLRTLAALAAVFAIGAVAFYALRLGLARPRRRLEQRERPSLPLRVLLLAARTGLDLLPVLAFGAVAHGALALAAPPERVRLVALAVVQAVVTARAILVVARLVVAPLAPGLRLVRLADADAAYAYVWIARLVNVGVYGAFAAEAAPLLGASPAGRAAILHATGFALALLAFLLVLQLRKRVAAALRGSAAQAGARGAQRALALVRRRVAEVWHVLAGLYVLGAYLVWALDVEGGFLFLLRGTLGTLAALVAAVLLARLAHHGIDRLLRVSPELRARFPGLEVRTSRYLPLARGVASAVIGLAAAVFALHVWSLDALGFLTSAGGLALLRSLLRIGLIVALAFAAWEIVRIALRRWLGAEREVVTQRARTLLPLAETVLAVGIATVAGMILLSELGVNIAPLLAGAGILGLAVGFGAQSLVKDVITGAFILFEDTISIGDVVDVAGYTGIVEAINVRSIRHRDLSGTLHTIPFSNVDVVRNLTKVYSYYLSDVGVAYREDTDEVVGILRRVLEEMREDPDFRERILEPLEVMGVQSFEDSAVAVRVRIKTPPGDQWGVGREFNRRVKKAFDEAGVEIPFPHRTLYFGVDKEGAAPPARVHVEGEAGAPADAEADPAQPSSRSRPDATS